MRLSRSDSVVKRRNGKKFRNKFKGKKKHKKLDAICETAYNRSHSGVGKVDSSEFNNGGNELEIRRSNRARRAPVVLDSSPLPPKKRRKVDSSVRDSVEKVRREDGAQWEIPCSSSRDLDGENDGWRLRLRSRGKSSGSSGRVRGESSVKGKRKLFQDVDEFRDDMEPQFYDKKERLVREKSTVVKPKRPGRIKASNVLANDNQDIDLGGAVEGGKETNRDEVLEMMDETEVLQLETKLGSGAEDCDVALQLAEREEAAIEKDPELEECHSNENAETSEEPMGQEKLACDFVSDQGIVAEVDCATAVKVNGDGCALKPLEDETCKKSKDKYNASALADRKPRVKLGRRCGLCGGGSDGKPPKILVLDGADSEIEAYSGSSTSEEPNYDVWDGFGDQSGWLGRLLGPINDRFGIAGIWVHQQCAVWSPEVS